MVILCEFQNRAYILAVFIFIILFIFSLPSLIVGADLSILSKYISEYNLDIHRKSLDNGSYRGEEGILLIRPDIAQSLGIHAYIDQDYQDSMLLFKKADESLSTAKRAMASKIDEKYSGEYSKKIIDSFLNYKIQIDAAKEKLMAYRSKISKENDERLNEDSCYGIIVKLLEEGLDKYDSRLRDALGHLYNKCHGSNNNVFPLTRENVMFVNFIFRAFVEHASPADKDALSLDLDHVYADKDRSLDWKKLAGEELGQIAGDLEFVLTKYGDDYHFIDPLLFIALMKRESRFDPEAISYVGAAGLTQIMPQTANDMGMKNIYQPGYFNEALTVHKEEQKTRRKAMESLRKITNKDDIKFAEDARNLMQQSLTLKEKKERLFAKYRKELKETNNDDRFKPVEAMSYGLKYFTEMMKKHNGDISLALSSYNAGPHRISEYGGIPPFEETVTFRNQVLKHYREYIEKAE